MENKTFKIEVGQDVFLNPTGNNDRGWDGKPIHGRIVKIARKYFYVFIDGRPLHEDRFDRETFEYDEQDRNAGFVVYGSLDAFRKEAEYIMMFHDIRCYFSDHLISGYKGNALSYDTVKKIHGLLRHEGVI